MASDVVPRVVELLAAPSSARALQYEAAWLLSNVVYGDEAQTRSVVEAGGLDALVAVVRRTDDAELAAQALWACANVAGDAAFRPAVVAAGAVGALAEALGRATADGTPLDGTLAENGAWLLCNLVRHESDCGGDAALLWQMSSCLTTLLLRAPEDNEAALGDAAWAAARLLADEHAEANLQTLLHHPSGGRDALRELLPRIGTLVHHPCARVQELLRATAKRVCDVLAEDEALLCDGLAHVAAAMAPMVD